jgi:hypothetical protein
MDSAPSLNGTEVLVRPQPGGTYAERNEMTPTHCVMALALTVPMGIAAHAATAEDKAIEVIVAARSAIGGSKLETVKSISATGEYRRLIGERELNGEATIEIIVPDKIKRTEEMGIPGGPTMSRTVVLDGTEYWEDSTNRGGNFMRFGGPGGPDGPGGQGPSAADRERFQQMAQRRLGGELQRYLLVWLARTDGQITYGGEAEAEDGKADVIDVKSEGGTPLRVFFDQTTHLPLMLTYEGAQPRMLMRRAGGTAGGNAGPRPDPEEMRRRMAEPPKMVTFEVRFSEFKDVNGVMLPHQVSQSIEGKPTEEWTVSQFKVNPDLKPESFTKKNKS